MCYNHTSCQDFIEYPTCADYCSVKYNVSILSSQFQECQQLLPRQAIDSVPSSDQSGNTSLSISPLASFPGLSRFYVCVVHTKPEHKEKFEFFLVLMFCMYQAHVKWERSGNEANTPSQLVYSAADLKHT